MNKTVTGIELSTHARALGKVAFDSANGTVSNAAYDNVHDECVSVLTALAKAGHARSHALLNPPKGPQGGAPKPAAQDSKPRSEAAQLVGQIGL